jgi:hypothetical protein
MLIHTTTGKENLPTGSTQVEAVLYPCAQFPSPREATLANAKRGAYPGITVTNRNVSLHAAGENLSPKMGTWIDQDWDVPEGAILCLRATRSTRTGHHAVRVSGCMFLRLRASAPLHDVEVVGCGDRNASRFSTHTRGRFDILGPQQLHGLGVVPTLEVFRQFQLRGELFTLEQVAEATAAAVEVRIRSSPVPGGGEVAVARVVRRRAINLSSD